MKNIPEIDLVRLLRERKKEGFDILYKNYANALFIVILKIVPERLTAEDLLQETFIKIWRHIENYEETKGRLYTWMLNIARNTSIDHCKSKYPKLLGITYRIEEVENFCQDFSLMTFIDCIGIRSLTSCLEPKYYEVVDVIFFQEFSHEEAATELEIPLGTLKTRKRAAIRLLKTLVC